MYTTNGDLSTKAKKWVTVVMCITVILAVGMAVFIALTEYAANPVGAAITMVALGGIAGCIGWLIATNKPF